MRELKDFIDSHDNIKGRVRALETGAHPTFVDPGGYGRNTDWAKLTPRTPTSYPAGAAVRWRVRSDIVYFQTIGAGLDISGIIKWPYGIFQLGKAGISTADRRILVNRGGTPTILWITPEGRVYIQANPNGSGYLTITGSFPLA